MNETVSFLFRAYLIKGKSRIVAADRRKNVFIYDMKVND
jgi:hypothetical protein